MGFEADGEIRAADHKGMLILAIEQPIEEHGEARVALVFPDFAGYSGGDGWQDLKMGTRAAIEDSIAKGDGTTAVVLDCETMPFVDVTAARMQTRPRGGARSK